MGITEQMINQMEQDLDDTNSKLELSWYILIAVICSGELKISNDNNHGVVVS